MTKIPAILAAMLLAAAIPASAQSAQASDIKVQRIWNHKYSAFTSIAEFHGKYYVAFREAGGHIWDSKGKAEGEIRIISSKDGNEWKSVALLSKKEFDLRDPKLTVTPDGKLLVTMGGSVYKGKELQRKEPQVSFSTDGKHFSAPEPAILGEGIDNERPWIWRVTWHDGTGYGVSYSRNGLDLVSTQDGKNFKKVEDIERPDFPNETTIRFLPDGRMSMIVRTDKGACNGYWGVSDYPFKDWTWTTIPVRLGGPDYVITGPDSCIMCARIPNPFRTIIFKGDLNGHFTEVLTLPSSGDDGYPGLLVKGDELWVSYYSSHEFDERAAIYFTKIPLSRLGISTESD